MQRITLKAMKSYFPAQRARNLSNAKTWDGMGGFFPVFVISTTYYHTQPRLEKNQGLYLFSLSERRL